MEKSKLAILRNAAGMTQQELADKAGFSIGYISNIEYGRRNIGGISLRNAIRIADALGVQDLRDLINRED